MWKPCEQLNQQLTNVSFESAGGGDAHSTKCGMKSFKGQLVFNHAWTVQSVCGYTLVAVAVGPANCSWVLSEETPRVGLAIRVPAVVVVTQAAARVLHDIVWKLSPFQTGGTRVRLRHGAVVVSQFCESLRAWQRHCTPKGEESKYMLRKMREWDVLDERTGIWVSEDNENKRDSLGKERWNGSKTGLI